MTWTTHDIPDQTGRVAVVTGGNGGLGLATVKALAGAGAHVVMAARNTAKAAEAHAEVLAEVPDASVEVVGLDLGSLASVADAAAEVLAAHDRVDLLVANAGVMAMPEGRTDDGFETQLGINHLGHWALTSHLLPAILATPGSRVVTVSSTAQHQGRPLDPDNPFLEGDYDPWRAYGNSKLANRHFAVGLAQQLRRAGSTTRALTCHPGLTDSDLQATTVRHGGGGPLGPFFLRLTQGIGMSIERGALSQLRAATDPDAENGSMYGPLFGTNGPPVVKPLVRPGEAAAIRTLWDVSERLTGLPVDVPQAMGTAA